MVGLCKLIDGNHGAGIVNELRVVVLMPLVHILEKVQVSVVLFEELRDVVCVIKSKESFPVCRLLLFSNAWLLHLQSVDQTLKPVLSAL